MKNIIFALSIVFVCSAGHARGGNEAESGSQFTHQAAGGTFELTPQMEYDDVTAKLTTTSPSGFEMKGTFTGATFEYGLNSILSFGAGALSESVKTTFTPSGSGTDYTTSGLNDPFAYLNARLGTRIISLHLTGKYSVSPGHQTIDTKDNYNGYSGGNTGTGQAAIELNTGMAFLGVFGSSDFSKGDQTVDDSSSGTQVTHTYSGGAETAYGAYFETGSRPIDFGLYYKYTSVATQKKDGVDQQNQYSMDEFHVYIPIITGPVVLIPDAGYMDMKYNTTYATANNINKITGVVGKVDLRFVF